MQEIETLFRKKNPTELKDNFFKAIGDDWLLITAGTPDNFNTMTASWGTTGVFWHKPVAICFIRPVRHTYKFAEQNDYFTLSFFTKNEREILNYCGSKSGKDVDKIAGTGLNPLVTAHNGVSYQQSHLCFECRKIYFDDIKPEHFLLPGVDDKIYPQKDYHRMYIGEILNCYQRV